MSVIEAPIVDISGNNVDEVVAQIDDAMYSCTLRSREKQHHTRRADPSISRFERLLESKDSKQVWDLRLKTYVR